ncbi:MAG TPA: LysR family transcriptional regulator [Syntrophomonas sp.]|nr:LysR family transcriptional regulator [Syntrophomonas sp.]
MDIKQLRYFLAFSQDLNFSRSAERLYLSRQALSKAIHELEKEIGERLFVENNNKLVLTSCGKYLAEHSASLIGSFNELEESMQNWAGKSRIPIRAAIGTGSLNTLPVGLFDAFSKDHPEISLSLEEYTDRIVRERVRSQQVHLGILSSAPDIIQEFDYCLVRSGQLYLQISRENELAGKECIQIADLQDQPFISLGEECDMHNLFMAKCREAGFHPNIVLVTYDSNTANNMVLCNQGISFGHKQTLNMVAHPSVRMLPLNLNGTMWGTYTITKKGAACSAAVQTLLEYIAGVG